MKKIEFTVTQTGPVELTDNMGGDPAFKVEVEILSDNTKLNEAVKDVKGLFYHASEGWVPIVDDEEVSVYDLVGNIDEDLDNRLSIALDKLGNQALGKLFRLGEMLWNITHEDSVSSPASVVSEEIDELI